MDKTRQQLKTCQQLKKQLKCLLDENNSLKMCIELGNNETGQNSQMVTSAKKKLIPYFVRNIF